MSGKLHAIDLEVGSNENRLLRLIVLVKVNSGTSVAAPEAGFSADQKWQASNAPLFLPALQPVIICGQEWLAVFCADVFLSFAGPLVLIARSRTRRSCTFWSALPRF
jgi:OpgC protein